MHFVCSVCKCTLVGSMDVVRYDHLVIALDYKIDPETENSKVYQHNYLMKFTLKYHQADSLSTVCTWIEDSCETKSQFSSLNTLCSYCGCLYNLQVFFLL